MISAARSAFPTASPSRSTVEADGIRADGARGQGFRSIGRVAWQLERDGAIVEAANGHAVYRDERPPLAGEYGPVRLMCEILDYRYARYASGSEQMIHPFIHRGPWRDVQVWLPAIDYEDASDGRRAGAPCDHRARGAQGLPADELALGRARPDARRRRLAARGGALRAQETPVAQPCQRGPDLARRAPEARLRPPRSNRASPARTARSRELTNGTPSTCHTPRG